MSPARVLARGAAPRIELAGGNASTHQIAIQGGGGCGGEGKEVVGALVGLEMVGEVVGEVVGLQVTSQQWSGHSAL